MREIAKALAQEISLPSATMKNIWIDLPIDFRPGKYYLPIGEVQIDENQYLNVEYFDLTAGTGELHLIKGLLSHLSTSGVSRYAELVDNDGLLNNLRNKAGKYSQALLEFLKLITDEVKRHRVKLNFQDDGKPGLTKWFILTAWNDALSQADGHAWILDSWYHSPETVTPSNLWQLRCGPYIIGIANNNQKVKAYEKWHKKLRALFGKHPVGKDISDKSRELTNIFLEIRQRLQEFSDMDHLPGRCRLC